MARRNKLIDQEMESLIMMDEDGDESEEDPFHTSDEDEDYVVSSSSQTEVDSSDNESEASVGLDEEMLVDKDLDEEIPVNEEVQVYEQENVQNENIIWSTVNNDFQPRLQIPPIRKCVSVGIEKKSSEFDIFMKLFPPSLLIYIAQCTNKRLEMFEAQSTRRKPIPKTDAAEIEIVIGCSLIMAYNRVPNINCYWSQHNSLGNRTIQCAISRDRFKLIMSKLYFNDPEKPQDASKLYYIEEIVSCLKQTFPKYRTESPRQSIDESMTKFKGRSSLKQFMPCKPVKRGIKIWQRCDAITGYTYDMNIYCGREENNVTEGTLGERVVQKLVDTIRSSEVSLCFDRFFTSVKLLDSLKFAAVGTCMQNRKSVPKSNEKLSRGESIVLVNQNSTVCYKWKDTKDVIVLSNCHTGKLGTIPRKLKSGAKEDFSCPESIIFYTNFMGGVDRADQMSTLYELDRKSTKWWKKVFFKLLMTAVVNSYILSNDINRAKKPFLEFIVPLAEDLVADGKKRTITRARSRQFGRRSLKSSSFINVGDHLPIEGEIRRRCVNCSKKKKTGSKD